MRNIKKITSEQTNEKETHRYRQQIDGYQGVLGVGEMGKGHQMYSDGRN